MKKIISYSLWGHDPRYTNGAIRNAELAKEVYPGWEVRFYCGTSVPLGAIEKLISLNASVIKVDEPGNWAGMFWRFSAISDLDVDVMLSRDTDSRLTYREKAAVDEWLESDKLFHIMRDHPEHNTHILGGMWGARKPILQDMDQLISSYTKGDFWQVDQNFLRDIIYPQVFHTAYVHDEYFEKKPYPHPRDEKHFIGQAYAGDDKILDDDEYFIDRIKESLVI